MEDTESLGSDEMINKLEGITDHLENQIGSFRLVGRDIQGDIENGFVFAGDPMVEDGSGDDPEVQTE